MKKFKDIFSLAILIFSILSTTVSAQVTDKVEADSILHELLSRNVLTENWHEPMIISSSLLKPTSEKGLYMVEGKSFQVKSLRSDYYVINNDNGWTPVCDCRYPLETTINLLMNRINNNKHILNITHHLYGGKNKKLIIKMQNLFDMLVRNMEIYCSVIRINQNEIAAVLVFHHSKRNFIHMLQMEINTKELIDPESIFLVDMYTNIPQDNLKSIFSKKNSTEK